MEKGGGDGKQRPPKEQLSRETGHFPSHNVRCAEASGQKAQKSWVFPQITKGARERR